MLAILPILNIEDVLIRLRIPIDRVMLPREILAWHAAARIAPNNLVTEISRAEHRIHHLTKISIRLMVAVQIHSASPLQHTPNLNHALNHERQVSSDPVAMRAPSRQNQRIRPWARRPQLPPPTFVHIPTEAPDLLKLRRQAKLVRILKPPLVSSPIVIHTPRLHQLTLNTPLILTQRRD